MKKLAPLTIRTICLVKSIPRGNVLTYGQVANLISAPGCARNVSYVLSSCSVKYELPWHRVLNSKGKISLPLGKGYFIQKKRLEQENVIFDYESVDLKIFLWRPLDKEIKQILGSLPNHIPYICR